MIFPSDFIQVTRKPILQRIGNLSPAEGHWQLRLAVVHELHGMKTVICGHFWISQGYPRIDMDWYGGTPIAGWFIMENHGKPFTKMDDLDWFGGTRIFGNLHMDWYFFGGEVLKAPGGCEKNTTETIAWFVQCRGFHLSGRFMQSATVP